MSKLLVPLVAGLFAASVFAADTSAPVTTLSPAASPVVATAGSGKPAMAKKTSVKVKKKVAKKTRKAQIS